MKTLNIVYGLRNNTLFHVSEVEKGKKCNCICPSCKNPLIAKKGEKQAHHFAHTSENCEYGYETSLHLAAKEILSKAKEFCIPAVVIEFKTNRANLVLSPSKMIEIDNVMLEKRIDNIVPDVLLYSGGKPLFIEIFVTHMIDDEKREKIRKLGISTIEINLSKHEPIHSSKDLEDLLLNDISEKKWIYNSYEDKKKAELKEIAVKKDVISRGFAYHVDHCPLNSRNFHGKAYANVMNDCIYCEHCIDFVQEQDRNYNYIDHYILCSGH